MKLSKSIVSIMLGIAISSSGLELINHQTPIQAAKIQKKSVKKTSKPKVIYDFTDENADKTNARNWQIVRGRPLVQRTFDKNKIGYVLKTKNPYFQSIWNKAIQDWNNLGVIDLVPVTSTPSIVISGEPNQNLKTDWAGIQESYIYSFKDSDKNIKMAETDVKLSGSLYDINKYSYDYDVQVAEHELGHALGFGHDDTLTSDNQTHIMNSGDNYNGIGAPLGDYEKQTLQTYYK